MFVRGAVPGDRVRRPRHALEARLRRGRPGRGARAEPGAHRPTSRRTRARPGACCPTSASWRRRSARCARRSSATAASRSRRSRRSSPAEQTWRYRNKLEYSFGEDEDGELVLGFHKPGRWNEIEDVTEDVLASEEIDAVRNAVREWAREEGLTAWDRRERRRLPAQPRRARGTPQRPAAGAARHERGRLPRRGVRRRRCGADSVLWTQTGGVAETTRDGKTVLLQRRGVDRGDALRPALPRSRTRRSSRPTPRWPSASTAQAAEAAGLTGGERVYDLFCGIGTIGLTMAARAREVWGIEIVEQAIADAERNAELNGIAQRALHRRRRAHRDAPAGRARRASPTSCWSTRRAPGLSQKIVRRILETEPQRIVYVSLQPDDARAERAPDGRRRLRARVGPAGRHVPADAAHRGRRAHASRGKRSRP